MPIATTDERMSYIKKLEPIIGESPASDFDKTDSGQTREEKFPVKDGEKDRDLMVYRLPHMAEDGTQGFLYNVNNTRIIAAKEQWEEAHPGEILDPVKHVKEIEGFLTQNPTYGASTTEELKSGEGGIDGPNYLTDPILIDHTGVVWNGNRRLAILRSLITGKDRDGSSTYKPHYDKVPVCILSGNNQLNFDELKTLEGKLQIKKTFKQEYGTLELRCEIRRARKAGNSWGKIKKNFGDKYSEAELKKMEAQINFVDLWLERYNPSKKKDYDKVSKMGRGKGKSGIEVFLIPFADWQNAKEDLVEGPDGTPVTNPDIVQFKKIETEWFQHLSRPDVSHDTIRTHGKVRASDSARKAYQKADKMWQNFSEYTTSTVVTTGGVPVEKSFTPAVIKEAVANSSACEVLFSGPDAKDIANKALKNLEKIEDEMIPKNNAVFKTTMNDIQKETKRITGNKNYGSA